MIRLLKFGIVAALLMGLATTATVQYTARSEFCKSCHIMEPYYQSWADSAHSNVACVDCHYEPGLLETAEGKFKALSQLAKYATGTAGTKPWAEVSDQSCMRSGCHSERLIRGELQFGRVRFDHRHHLLETRRGRRLRCTSCHSQIVQGDHMRVTPVSCFLCHFRMSGESLGRNECTTCHGAPEEEIQVGDLSFRHREYIDRGVSCNLCHRDVIRGEGLARKNRCNSCHGEAAHIERFDDLEFIHENHITLHKVECTECHDEIEHGLTDRHEPEVGGDCAQCHPARHGEQWSVYAGQGAAGIESQPSPMYQTRVDCSACHRDFWGKSHAAGSSRATEVACLHCHGAGFTGMQASWQQEVEAALPPLEAALQELPTEGAGEEADRALAEARQNLDLIRRDGSKGVHNIRYALAALRAARDRINEAGPGISGSFQPLELDIGVPGSMASDCASACHVDVARKNPRFADVSFQHRPHLVTADMDCLDCHSEERHGVTTMTPQDCTGCHHDEGEGSESSCATCHDREAALLRCEIEIEGADLELENDMGGLECRDCHQKLDAPDQIASVKETCVACHSAGYDEMVDEWRAGAAEELDPLVPRIAALRKLLAAAPASENKTEAAALLARAEACYEAARLGRPGHNVIGAMSLAAAAGGFLDACEELLKD